MILKNKPNFIIYIINALLSLGIFVIINLLFQSTSEEITVYPFIGYFIVLALFIFVSVLAAVFTTEYVKSKMPESNKHKSSEQRIAELEKKIAELEKISNQIANQMRKYPKAKAILKTCDFNSFNIIIYLYTKSRLTAAFYLIKMTIVNC